jgi:ketosteroid isomerase-like protein
MKNLILLLSVMFPAILFAQNWSADEKAIIDALHEEGAAFIEMDMDQLAAVHVQDGRVVRYDSGDDTAITGWPEIKANFEQMFETRKDMSWEKAKNTKENLMIKVTGITAWVLCDNVWSWEENGEKKGFVNKEIAFLEKEKGTWKLSFYTFIVKPE